MKMFEILNTHKSIKSTTIQFIRAHEAYAPEEREAKAREYYSALSNDGRLSIETKDKLMRYLKKIIKNGSVYVPRNI